jgi:hypothetical protein
MQLKSTELNYPVHEKELFAIIWALKKWCSSCLGGSIYMYTDHWTIENFNAQCDLFHHQLRWQEFISQYDMSIVYIKGKDNTVANVLSWLPCNTFVDEHMSELTALHMAWAKVKIIGTLLTILADSAILNEIKKGYKQDNFCRKSFAPNFCTPSIHKANGLWYAGSCLIILCTGDIWEQLF